MKIIKTPMIFYQKPQETVSIGDRAILKKQMSTAGLIRSRSFDKKCRVK